jgi:HPt (histidine-containing phosphotransfer) domain-containing protein
VAQLASVGQTKLTGIRMTTMIHSPVDEETYTLLQEIMADEFAELIDFFITDAEQSLVILHQCVAIQDHAQVGAICHKLKSSSKLIGAFDLAEFAHLLEDYREHHNQQTAATHLNSLQNEFTKVLAWLNQQSTTA